MSDRHTTWRLLFCMAALTVLLCLTGCSDKDHVLVLSLDANPASGFEWQVEQADTLFDVNRQYHADKSGDKKDGGKETFELVPVEAGFTNVTFTYVNPETKQQGAQYSYSLIVDEHFGIELVSKTGELAGASLSKAKIPDPVVQ